MRLVRIVFTLVFLASCDSPSPYFMSGEQTEVVIDGSRFSVHRQGSLVEVYRMSMEWRPRLSVVLARARLAIEQVTGCPVREGSLQGDHALIRAQLDCDGDLRPVTPARRHECTVGSGGMLFGELDCEEITE